MDWTSFREKIKSLSPDIWFHENGAVQHSKHKDLEMLGLYLGNTHVCGVTYDSAIPERDIYDENGVMTHQGLRAIREKLYPHFGCERVDRVLS